MKQKKINHFNIKLKLTLFVLAFSLLPILYISIYVNLKFTKHLQDQAYLYYSNILKQITQNVDSTFLNYSIKLSDVTKTDNFKTIINWPEYKTKIEERFYLAEMGEDINIPKINSLIWNVYTNINGLFAIIEDITSSSVLHDIGKVGIENQVLLKPGKLTAEEYEVIKGHAIIGGDALSNADHELGIKSFLTLAKEICYYHHEKYDGTGYPKGLKGDDIPLSARITALADVYDALTADRCYRKALSHVEAADIIINKDVGHFDPDIVLCFIENQHKFIEIKNLYRNIELKDHMIN